MPSQALTAAIREAYASARSDVFYLDTLSVQHKGTPSLFLVADRVDHYLKLENGKVKQFLPCGFRFSLPATGENGLQELSISIDNVNRRPSDFLKGVIDSPDSVSITYRPYLSTNFEEPAMNPPLTLFLTDIVVNATEIVGRATFADILNRNFLSPSYTRRKFPGL